MTVWDLADACGNVRVRDVAAVVGVDKQTVYKFVQAGLIPCRRLPISGILTFQAADVEQFVLEMQHDTKLGRK